ncbi:uncharacterized protein VTP21DRAFT_1404 [Calcarisporiella thermophila]|uniref:uncharacterized protein n=1 Tax=Calcarisporiella thermophila TaxID=911321 RepID=UPI0037441400
MHSRTIKSVTPTSSRLHRSPAANYVSPFEGRQAASTRHRLDTPPATPVVKDNMLAPSAEPRVGDRVAVPSMGLVGILRFIGEIEIKPGVWAGLELEGGGGKNSGSVNGVKYFDCAPNSGIFVLANKLTKIEEPRVAQTKTPTPPSVPTTAPSTQLSNSAAPSTRKTPTTNRRVARPAVPDKSPVPATPVSKVAMKPPAQPKTTPRTGGANVSRGTKGYPANPSAAPTAATMGGRAGTSTTRERSVSNSSSTSSTLGVGAYRRGAVTPSGRSASQASRRSASTTPTPVSPRHRANTITRRVAADEKDIPITGKTLNGARASLVSEEENSEHILRLMEVVQSREERIRGLEAELAQMKLQVEEKQVQMADEHNAINEYHTHEVEELKSQIKELERLGREAIMDYERRVEALEEELRERDDILRSLDAGGAEGIAPRAEELEDLQSLLEERNERIAALETEIEDLRRVGEDALEAVATMKHEKEAAEAVLAKEQEGLSALRVELDQVVRQQNARDEKHKEGEAARGRLEKEMLDLKKQLREVERERDELAARVEAGSLVSTEPITTPPHDAMVDKDVEYEGEINKLKRAVQELERRNALLTEERDDLLANQKRMEGELLQLMDEVERLHTAESTAVFELLGDDNPSGSESGPMDEVEKLKALVREKQRALDQQRRNYGKDTRELRDSLAELERKKEREVKALQLEVAELEAMVESNVMRETDMEARLEREKKESRRLAGELEKLKRESASVKSSARSSASFTDTTSMANAEKLDDEPAARRHSVSNRKAEKPSEVNGKPGESAEAELYCDICEAYGHDILTCNVVFDPENKK